MKPIHNRTPLMLCIIGGSLMLLSGASGAVGVVGDIIDDLQHLFGEEFVVTLSILMGILGMLMMMCGAGVIVAGIVLTSRRVEAGRNIILVAVGTGVLGLIISLFLAAVSGNLAMDWRTQITQSLGWVGAILAIEARIIAEQMPVSVSE
ncbi:MAG: hypothetical protein ACTSPE_07020 [Candidatus Thorarchaeota archaeon]